MGIGSSFFSWGDKHSGDADGQFMDNLHLFNDKIKTGTDDKAQTDTAPFSEFYAKALVMTPKERAATFGNAPPSIPYVTRDKQSEPQRSTYSSSPIKSSQTSPSSFKVSLETPLAYPSPSNLHSPLLSYTNEANQVSPIMQPTRRPRGRSVSPGTSPGNQHSMTRITKHRSPNFFYSSIPSPSWKPLSRPSYDDERSSSLNSEHPWVFPSSQWSYMDMDTSRQSKTMDQMYYHGESGQFYLGSPKERRYF